MTNIMTKNDKRMKSYLEYMAVSGLSCVSVHIKSGCSLTGNCFEMPKVSCMLTLYSIQRDST